MWGNINSLKSFVSLCLASSFLLRARTRADARERGGDVVRLAGALRSFDGTTTTRGGGGRV